MVNLKVFKITLLAAAIAVLASLSGCLPYNDAEEYRPVYERRQEYQDYSSSEIEYFLEIAMGAEYGSSNARVHKWPGDIKIDIKGSPTDEDMETVLQVISELEALMGGTSIDIVNWSPDIEMYFTSTGNFRSIEPHYVSGNVGFFWCWWNEYSELYDGTILIATNEVTQEERSHIIREEITQSLGLMNDSYRYEDSIFYQNWTDVRQYSEMDRAVISILYDSRIAAGMTVKQVKDVLY